MLHLIVAMTKHGVIGSDNGLPWDIPEEKKLFKKLTMGHPMIMGRKTYETIGRVLPGRQSIVISHQDPQELATHMSIEHIHFVRTPEAALELAKTFDQDIFVIGGAQIFRHFLPLADVLHVSWVHTDYPGTVMFPEVNWQAWKQAEDKSFAQFTYKRYKE